MRRRRVSSVLLWTVAILVTLLSLGTWRAAVPVVTEEVHSVPNEPTSHVPVDSARITAAAATIPNGNPFRLHRRPSNVRFDPFEPLRAQADSPAVADPARPSLVLVGIVGGPPWNVLVDGIPDRPNGVLFGLGEQTSGIRFDHIRGDTVVFIGLDTTWVLTPSRIR